MSTPPSLDPEELRRVASSFGVDAAAYDRARPRYPDALVAAIADAARDGAAGPVPHVLDVGVGTGIVARQLRAAGCAVLGVDVDARMAEVARGDGVEVEVARFEEWDPAGRTFDAVTAGQTWHWVDPDAGAARAADVLRPGGALTVFWNAGDPPHDLAVAFAEVYRDVLPGSPLAATGTASAETAYRQMVETAADGVRRTGRFAEPRERRDAWERTYTRDEWLSLVPTTGVATRLPAAQLDALLTGLGAAIDSVGGSFVQQGFTLSLTAARG
ncbi:class I SAM-dependent methyltransferase [Isoptericola sp. 4D.3]|uniref:Class I SAM-dependent methyltransferase n=1 Tax=Isoptericola peretonis TaxID=2918523 RepID=A0ABT0J4K5_9MICO|nr:class I SAM-dependent methyltransferase [Isoptericola sp. 4D.3]